MSTLTVGERLATVETTEEGKKPVAGDQGKWWRFAALLLITAIVLVPIAAVLILSVQPALGSTSTAPVTLENFGIVFAQTNVATWLFNSTWSLW